MKVAWVVALVGMTGVAAAGEMPGEADLALALRAAGISLTQLDRAQMAFGQSLEALKQQAAKAVELASKVAYWEDACRSTPECGGKAP